MPSPSLTGRNGIILAALSLPVVATVILAASPIPYTALLGVATICAFVFAWRVEDGPHRQKELPRVHFPGLNGLRFLAAFLVIIHHTEEVKYDGGFDSLWAGKSRWSPAVLHAGESGVTFFFVLSGFLITYLLMVESRETGTIRVRDFYARRVLRIWPVYFLVGFLCFCILPHFELFHHPGTPNVFDQTYWPRLALFLVMWVHAAGILYPGLFMGNVLWTVSVEEGFYFFWPLLVRTLKTRMVYAMVAIIPVMIVLRQLSPEYLWLNPNAAPETLRKLETLGAFFSLFRVDCMAIGGLGAWLCLRQSVLLKPLFHWTSQLCLAAVLAFCFFKGSWFGPFYYDAYSMLFLLVILNVATNPRSLLKLENRPWEFLGRISYGLYAYNWIVAVMVINTMRAFWPAGNFYLLNLCIYFAELSLVILLASASYFLMERRFLRLKRSFGSLSKVGMETAPMHGAS